MHACPVACVQVSTCKWAHSSERVEELTLEEENVRVWNELHGLAMQGGIQQRPSKKHRGWRRMSSKCSISAVSARSQYQVMHSATACPTRGAVGYVDSAKDGVND